MQCHARPAPCDMQCHAHPMPCAPFLTFVKHNTHFLCMLALEYSAPGVCLCAEIVSRWSAHQGLSGMVRVSDVPHLTKSAGSNPPRMFCLLSRAANVRARAYAHGRVRVCVCVCACIGLHEPLDLWRVYFAEPQSPTGPKKRIQGGDCCPRRMSLLRFPWLFPIRNPFELRGLCSRSYFGPRTCGRSINHFASTEVFGILNQGFPFSPLLREV